MSDFPSPPSGDDPPPPPPPPPPQPQEPATEQLQTTEPPAVAAPAKSEWRQRWPWIAGIVVALLVGVAIGAGGPESDEDTDELATTQADLDQAEDARDEAYDLRDEAQVERDEALDRVAELEAELEAVAEATTTTTEAPTTTAPPTTAAPAGFGDGTYVVGEDIEPGRYSAPGGELCYWERLSGFGGTFDEIIANNISEGPATVEIAASDAGFTTNGCGTWTPAG